MILQLLRSKFSKKTDTELAVIGNGVLGKTEIESLDNFKNIEVHGSMEVNITKAERYQITVKADSNIIELLDFKFSKENLKIGLRRNTRISIKNLIQVDIKTPNLASTALYGSGEINVNKIDVPIFKATLHGSGDITLSGKTSHLFLTLKGSGNINALNTNTHFIKKHPIIGSGTIQTKAQQSIKAI